MLSAHLKFSSRVNLSVLKIPKWSILHRSLDPAANKKGHFPLPKYNPQRGQLDPSILEKGMRHPCSAFLYISLLPRSLDLSMRFIGERFTVAFVSLLFCGQFSLILCDTEEREKRSWPFFWWLHSFYLHGGNCILSVWRLTYSTAVIKTGKSGQKVAWDGLIRRRCAKALGNLCGWLITLWRLCKFGSLKMTLWLFPFVFSSTWVHVKVICIFLLHPTSIL